MRLGGEAKFVIEVETKEDALEAVEFADEKGLAFYFLGGGANSIGRDEGFGGAIIMNKIRGVEVITENSEGIVVKVGGGEVWDDFVKVMSLKGYSGIEAMAKIPGTVGAAPVQNIGAYGQEVSQTLESVEVFDTLLGEYKEIKKDEMDFSYRHSIFNSGETAGRYFILNCTFRLKKDKLKPPFYNSLQAYLDEHEIKDYTPENIYMAVADIREHKLPDPKKIASAGSFFKNIVLSDKEADEAEARGIQVYRTETENSINTGWLLEQAGLKGKLFHGFRVSEKAALILINESGESYKNLEVATKEISEIIFEKFGFRLEWEPVVIGEKK